VSQLWNVSLHTYGPLIEALRVITDYQRNGRRRLRFYIRTESEELEDLDNTTSLDVMICVNLANSNLRLDLKIQIEVHWKTLLKLVIVIVNKSIVDVYGLVNDGGCSCRCC